MFAIIGLGNPGTRYESTRHNMGSRAVAQLADRLGVASQWKEKSRASFIKVRLGSAEALLVIPLDFMNLSGEAIQPLLQFFKVAPQDCVVLYDELDLPPAALRIAKGGSAGGHRGVQDMIRHLGTPDFFRIRIGIGHPRTAEPPLQIDVSDYVLGTPKGEERRLLDEILPRAGDAAICLVEKGLEVAQRNFN